MKVKDLAAQLRDCNPDDDVCIATYFGVDGMGKYPVLVVAHPNDGNVLLVRDERDGKWSKMTEFQKQAVSRVWYE